MDECQIKEFTDGYIECAVWADKPDDSDACELTKDARATLIKHAEEFISKNSKLITTAVYSIDGYPYSHAGHDLWLTQRGHGAGYWDRGLSDIGDELTRLCENQYCDGLAENEEGMLELY